MQGLENRTNWEGRVVIVEELGKADDMEFAEEMWMSPNHFVDRPILSVVCARDIEEDNEEDIDSDFFYDDDDDDFDDDLDDDFDDDDDDDFDDDDEDL